MERSYTSVRLILARKQRKTQQEFTHLAVFHRILKEEELEKRHRERKSKRELLLGTSWKLWTYLISDLGVDNLSKEGRTLTVTNNYFWQPLNSQTYCPGSGQLLCGSIELGQLRQKFTSNYSINNNIKMLITMRLKEMNVFLMSCRLRSTL